MPLGSAIEDEEHVLFACPHPPLSAARDQFYLDVVSAKPAAVHMRRRMSDWRFLATTLLDDDLSALAAEFVHATFVLVKTVPVYEIRTDVEWARVGP